MPIVPKDELRRLVVAGQINAITLDTSIFSQKRNRLESMPLLALSQQSRGHVSFLLSDVVLNEIKEHMTENQTSDAQKARESLTKLFEHWPGDYPPVEEILSDLVDSPLDHSNADKRLQSFFEATRCQLIECGGLVRANDIMNDYFAQRPPSSEKKKNEFPDAFALKSLELKSRLSGIKTLVVAHDRDWQAFCRDSDVLFHIESLEEALDILQSPRQLLTEKLTQKLEDKDCEELRQVVFNAISDAAGASFFEVEASSAFRVEVDASFRKLIQISFDRSFMSDALKNQLILGIEDYEISALEGARTEYRYTILFRVTAVMELDLELRYYLWESVDREEMLLDEDQMGYDLETAVSVYVSLVAVFLDGDFVEIRFEDCTAELWSTYIDLGEVHPYAED